MRSITCGFADSRMDSTARSPRSVRDAIRHLPRQASARSPGVGVRVRLGPRSTFDDLRLGRRSSVPPNNAATCSSAIDGQLDVPSPWWSNDWLQDVNLVYVVRICSIQPGRQIQVAR